MGIESTKNIKRQDAIDRILSIIISINEADWIKLYNNVSDIEEPHFIDNFVNEFNDIDKEYNGINKIFQNIDKWPNKYLEDFMDKPGIRYSIFENYTIEG